MRSALPLMLALILTALQGVARSEETFQKVGVYLEQTVEDQDSEIMFEAIGGDLGLATLKVVEPPKRKGGGKVADVKELVSKLRNEAKVI